MILKYKQVGVEAFVSLSRYLDEHFGGANGNGVWSEDAAKHFSDLTIPEGQQWCVADNDGSMMSSRQPFARLMSCKSSYVDGEFLVFDVTIEVPDEVEAARISQDDIGSRNHLGRGGFAPNTNDIVTTINDIVAGRKTIEK